jgi:hypothetical protein
MTEERDRRLPWSAIGLLRKGRRLAPRLKVEAARHGQPVPTINLP